MDTEEYGKGVRFCQQALDIRPQNGKACMRKGDVGSYGFYLRRLPPPLLAK